MLAYRIYTLDDETLVVKAKVVEARDDDGAVVQAKSMLNGHDLEIWTGTRRVAQLRASDQDLKQEIDF